MTKTCIVSATIVTLVLLNGCANKPQSTVITSPPINYDKVMIVPNRVVDSCDALPELTDGSKSGVLNWAIDAHGSHGICMFRKDLSDDFLRAAAETQSRVELFNPKVMHK